MIAQVLYQYILRVYGELQQQHIENQYDDKIKLEFDIMQDIIHDMEAYGYDEIYCEDILNILHGECIKYWIKCELEESPTKDEDEESLHFLRRLLNIVRNILTDYHIL